MQEWAIQINACKQSGKTVQKWCEENGINAKTFYNRMRVVREEMLEIAEAVNVDRGNDVVKINASRLLPAENQYDTADKMRMGHIDGPVFAALPIPQAATDLFYYIKNWHAADINGHGKDRKHGRYQSGNYGG
jgi:hypothetical protein